MSAEGNNVYSSSSSNTADEKAEPTKQPSLSVGNGNGNNNDDGDDTVDVTKHSSIPVGGEDDSASTRGDNYHHHHHHHQENHGSNNNKNKNSKITFSQKWTRFIRKYTRGPITRVMHAITQHAAHHPYLYMLGIIALSLSLVAAGIGTNFRVETDEQVLYTPTGSIPEKQGDWVKDHSGFPKSPRGVFMLIHAEGQNVLNLEGVQRVFEVVDAAKAASDYATICSANIKENVYIDPITGNRTCRLSAVTRFWNDSSTIFKEQVKTDQDAILHLSRQTFGDGTPVDTTSIIGKPVFGTDGNLTFGQAFLVDIDLPNIDATADLEKQILDRLQVIRNEWTTASENSSFRLEYTAIRSFADEFDRAIENDLILLPVVFILMSVFTCVAFARCDAVKSRSLLGFGLVVSVLLALFTGYGFLFLLGVPFTSFAQILPFIIFGVGLDDGFIIIGEFSQTNPKKDVFLRIHETIEKVGVSILMTTLTSALAFATGATSTIPTVYWLCYYAVPTILLVLFYQLTFFIALLVIDERRLQGNRRDCLLCFHGRATDNDENNNSAGENDNEQEHQTKSLEARIMAWYADQLLRPWVKVTVIIAFLALFAGQIYSTTLLTQEFKYTDTVPKDSYVTAFWDHYSEYIGRGGVSAFAYFRDVDQSDPTIQTQMKEYIDDLVGIPAISDPPPFFWLVDFESFEKEHEAELQNKTFVEKLDAFLSPDGGYYSLYQTNIIRNSNGTIKSSRVNLYFDKVDQDSVSSQIEALKEQRDVTNDQPINEGTRLGPFFCHDEFLNIWEFYAAAVYQLSTNTVQGIAAVTFVALLLIPHWTAVFFIFPLVLITYVDMLGALQSAGVHINVVSYITLLMSIGLIVDFLMHVMLRYYESKALTREAKVKDTLESMGASILLGASSTLLGVLPLALASSNIVNTIFVSFIALVTIGAGHGLIFLPVVLSICGPTDMDPDDMGGEPPSRMSTLEEAQEEAAQRHVQ